MGSKCVLCNLQTDLCIWVVLTVATYFETTNSKTGTIQINDTYMTYAVKRTGKIKANLSKGVVYGLAIADDEVLAGFRVKSGTLFVSPTLLHDNSKVQYVACDGDQEISYFTYAPVNKFTPVTHGAGVEIYDATGRLIYSSHYPSAKFIDFKTLPFKGSYDAANIYYNGNDTWDSYSIANNNNRYIVVYSSPWEVWPSIYRTFTRRNSVAGFVFSDGVIKNETGRHWPSDSGIVVKTLTGYGSIGHFGTNYHTSDPDVPQSRFYDSGGIFSFDFCFSVMDLTV